MRMNAARMKKVAEYAATNRISKTAKDMLTLKGNGVADYSFTDNLQICKNAVRRAVQWNKANDKRSQTNAK